MNDAKYTFIEQQRETKAQARGAKHRVCGSKSRKCTLPHERLTPAQLKKRNGKVATYTMNSPHTYEELKAWSPDLRREYLAGLKAKYDPTYRELEEMLETSHGTVLKLMQEAGLAESGARLTRRGHRGREHDELWQSFAQTHEKAPTSNDSSDNIPAPPAQENAPVASPRVTAMTTKLEGLPAAVFDRAYGMLDADCVYEVTITAVRKGVC